ncbi:MAG: thiamine pyrophosphate-dependent enzyme, partial [Pseudomonadota bacterium]
GMLGMHGTYEANMAMHQCDVMLAIGARFDDRITGLVQDFAPNAKIIHIDIDPSSINKIIAVEVGVLADAEAGMRALLQQLERDGFVSNQDVLEKWWSRIETWKARNSLSFTTNDTVIKPQQAIQRLHALTKDRDIYITTEVGQHQMWAAQHFHFEKPCRWMTSGGLGTMGYGLPAAIGVQLAHPDALVVDIAGEASILMNMQEMSTAVQYRLPIKIFILNNEYMGMVRQWQELLHGSRYSESYTEALPDFVKLAEAYGATGMRIHKPSELDEGIKEMIATPGPVIVDVMVDKAENCLPMIPSGKPHCEMILPDTALAEKQIDARGRQMV